MTNTSPPTRRTYSTGAGVTQIDRHVIEREARAAAHAGHSLAYSCPYPFGSEAGQHFVAVYYLNRQVTPRTAQVLARSAHALELPQ